MFIVYSPEGQSFIGLPPPKSRLKVDPVNPVRPVEGEGETLFPQEMMEEVKRNAKSQLTAYEEVKEAAAKKVVVHVREIMSSPAITIEPGTDLNQAQSLMQKSHVHALPVLQEGALVGLITEYDLVEYCIRQPDHRVERLLKASVSECMQKQVITALPQTEIRRVAMVMHQYAVHALPVMSEIGEVVGMVTRSDLIERLAELPPIELYV